MESGVGPFADTALRAAGRGLRGATELEEVDFAFEVLEEVDGRLGEFTLGLIS
jgi:hypothetical protein